MPGCVQALGRCRGVRQNGALPAGHAIGSLTPLDFKLPADPEVHMGAHGLYATVGGYMRFIRMWLNDGTSFTGYMNFETAVYQSAVAKMAA